MRHDDHATCDGFGCKAEVHGNILEVAKRLAADRWWSLRLESIVESSSVTLCPRHGRSLFEGDRGALAIDRRGWSAPHPLTRALETADVPATCAIASCPTPGEYSELRLETVVLPGGSFVARICESHALAVTNGARLSVPAERWIEDRAGQRALAAMFGMTYPLRTGGGGL